VTTPVLGTSVFDSLAGQFEVVQTLRRAAVDADRAVAQRRGGSDRDRDAVSGTMTHSWLFTGPPGSGRSVAARAFAAALQC
jgi:DNA polymerase III subunit delta'